MINEAAAASGISIHALREEGDPLDWYIQHGKKNFYPRPPRGGRLIFTPFLSIFFQISIHALREEGDPP